MSRVRQTEFWPTYFWYVAYHPLLPGDHGRKIRERSGYADSPEEALSRVADNSDPLHTIGIGVQKQWSNHHDLPLLRWTKGMKTPEHLA